VTGLRGGDAESFVEARNDEFGHWTGVLLGGGEYPDAARPDLGLQSSRSPPLSRIQNRLSTDQINDHAALAGKDSRISATVGDFAAWYRHLIPDARNWRHKLRRT
jgi:hypothetical protein